MSCIASSDHGIDQLWLLPGAIALAQPGTVLMSMVLVTKWGHVDAWDWGPYMEIC